MTLHIPGNLKKYCSLAEDEDIIDRFVCPVEGCEFDTRLGPGAIRMHILMKADPMSAVYASNHEAFFKDHQDELTMNAIKELAKVPFRKISYRE